MRAPFQVLVVPFRMFGDRPEYLLMRRADLGVWQWVAGGGEDVETPLEAARRELEEETGYLQDPKELDSRSAIPVIDVCESLAYGVKRPILMEFAFAAEVPFTAVRISEEHTEVAWLTYEEARSRLNWDSNRTALWETNFRIESSFWGLNDSMSS